MREKFTKIAIRMVAVLATVMLCLPLVVSTTTVSVYAAGEASVDTSSNSDTMTNPYEITIPAVTTIDSTDKTGSVSFHGKLNKYNTMSIAVSSANSNKMVNGSYDIDYTMDKNSFSYDTDDAIKSFSDSINFEVTSTAEVAGTYSDQLTFAISVEAKAVEVTVNHNDGAGTTSTISLPIGSAVLASLPTLTREGYKLDGWTYTDASGNEVEIDENTIYDGTITEFNAKWMSMNPVLQKGIDFYKNIASTVTAIEFTTEAMPSTVTSYTDVSESQDGSILAYMDGTTMKVSPKYDGMTIYANKNCRSMFAQKTNLTSISFDNFNTSKVTDMDCMFFYCTKLTSLDVTNFNTSNVTNMNGMFWNCSSLAPLDVTKFDTSKVIYMSNMFYNCSSLTSLDVTKFDTSKVIAMQNMFYGCSKLTSLDLSSFDTSNVTNMGYMFNACKSLTSLNLSNFNTSKVTNMSSMFDNCSSLTTLDVSNFKTNLVTSMSGMFSGCSSLTELNVSGFDTSKVTNMFYMFNGCSKLTSLDVSKFNTSSVTNMNAMFGGCSGLTSLNLSSFNTSKVTDMQNMFNGCSKITSFDLSSFDTTNVTSYNYVFADCSVLSQITVGDKWVKSIAFPNTGVSSSGTWYALSSGTGYTYNAYPTGTADTYTTTKQSGIVFDANGNTFANGSTINIMVASDTSTYQTVVVSDTGKVFKGWATTPDATVAEYKADGSDLPTDKNLKLYAVVGDPVLQKGTDFNKNIANTVTAIEFTAEAMPSTVAEYTDVSEAQDESILAYMDGTTMKVSPKYDGMTIYANEDCRVMFARKTSIASISFDNFDTSNVTTMYGMFYGCQNLTSLDVTKFNTSKVTDMSYLFYGCRNLESLDVTKFSTSKVTNMSYMFSDCQNLTTLDVSKFNTSNVTNMSFMFNGCQNLTSLDVTKFDTNDVTNMSFMFYGCSKLASLDVTKFNTSNVNNMSRMFYGCQNLTTLNVTNFDTNKVTNMSLMFRDCQNLTTLDVSKFNTSNVTNMSFMFNGCQNLESLDVTEFSTSKVTDMSYMFYGCQNLTTLNVTNFDTSKVTNMSYMFSDCQNLTTLDVSKFNTSNVTNMSYMFTNCSNLKTIDTSSNFVTTNVNPSNYMFLNCKSLVGGNGTKYNLRYVDKTYARIDTASTPGYFTLKSSDEEASDTDIVSVVSLEDMMVEKTYSAEDFEEVISSTEPADTTVEEAEDSVEESSTPSEETSSHLEGTDKVVTPSAETTESDVETTEESDDETVESSDESSSDSAISAVSLFTPTPSVVATLEEQPASDTNISAQADENNNGVSGDGGLAALIQASPAPEATQSTQLNKFHLNSDEELDAILEANVASVRIEGTVVGEMPEYDEEKFVVEVEEESGALVINVVDGAEVSADDWKALLYSDMFESIGEECKISVEVKGVEAGTVFEGFEEVVSSEE